MKRTEREQDVKLDLYELPISPLWKRGEVYRTGGCLFFFSPDESEIKWGFEEQKSLKHYVLNNYK
jgi:hypothetical protein